jgi:general stress protein YciG
MSNTTDAEVEGRLHCEIHGDWDVAEGDECPMCLEEGRTGSELVPVLGPLNAEGLPVHARDIAQVDDHTVARKAARPRGFAAMDRALVSAIARKGGQAAHREGTAHEFTSDEAREAGRRGGRVTHERRKKAREAAK